MISGYLRMSDCNLAPVMTVGEPALLITAFIGPQQLISQGGNTGAHGRQSLGFEVTDKDLEKLPTNWVP